MFEAVIAEATAKLGKELATRAKSFLDVDHVGFIKTLIPINGESTKGGGLEHTAFFHPETRQSYMVVNSMRLTRDAQEPVEEQARELLAACNDAVLGYLQTVPGDLHLLDKLSAWADVIDGKLMTEVWVYAACGARIPEF